MPRRISAVELPGAAFWSPLAAADHLRVSTRAAYVSAADGVEPPLPKYRQVCQGRLCSWP